MKRKINVKNTEIVLFQKNKADYISLTDIAKYKNSDDPRFVVQNWMKTRYTVDFLGIWEVINNPDFNRVEFDTFRNEAGTNAFVLTPQKWIKKQMRWVLFLNREDMAEEHMPIRILLSNLLPGYRRSLNCILLKNSKDSKRMKVND